MQYIVRHNGPSNRHDTTALSRGDQLFEQKVFAEAKRAYEAAISSVGLTDKEITSGDNIRHKIPKGSEKDFARALGRLGVSYSKIMEKKLSLSERGRFHEKAVAYLEAACKIDLTNDWNLLNLGMICTPAKDSGLTKARIDKESFMAAEAFNKVLANHRVTDEHRDGSKPVSDVGLNPGEVNVVLWALNDLGLLRYKQGVRRKVLGENTDAKIFFSDAADCFKTVLDVFSIPREPQSIPAIGSGFNRLMRNHQRSINIAFDRLGETLFHMEDYTSAYHCFNISSTLSPGNKLAADFKGEILAFEPDIRDNLRGLAGQQAIEPKPPGQKPPEPGHMPEPMEINPYENK